MVLFYWFKTMTQNPLCEKLSQQVNILAAARRVRDEVLDSFSLIFHINCEGSIDWSTNPACSKLYQKTPKFASKARFFGPFLKFETAQYAIDGAFWRKVSSVVSFVSSIFFIGNMQLFVWRHWWWLLKMSITLISYIWIIWLQKPVHLIKNWILHFICLI